jgi:hypothetical protein
MLSMRFNVCGRSPARGSPLQLSGASDRRSHHRLPPIDDEVPGEGCGDQQLDACGPKIGAAAWRDEVSKTPSIESTKGFP